MSNGYKLWGRVVTITSRDSEFYNEWGVIKWFDGEYYHIAMYKDLTSELIFERNEFRVKRNEK